jgi:hypothetical protein
VKLRGYAKHSNMESSSASCVCLLAGLNVGTMRNDGNPCLGIAVCCCHRLVELGSLGVEGLACGRPRGISNFLRPAVRLFAHQGATSEKEATERLDGKEQVEGTSQLRCGVCCVNSVERQPHCGRRRSGATESKRIACQAEGFLQCSEQGTTTSQRNSR